MRAAFFHIAVGSFGVECLGKLAELVREEALDDALLHRFLWLGLGARPEAEPLEGAPALPPWEFTPPKFSCDGPAPGPTGDGLTLDRGTLAARMAAALAETQQPGSAGQVLEWLVNRYVVDLFGQADLPVPHVTLCGSLADPSASAIFLGWLRGLEVLRRKGVAVPPLHVVAGVGAESGSVAAPHDVRRALAAQSLLDLQAYLSGGPAADRMAPIYLVGDRPPEEGLVMDRPSQVAVAAYTLLALAKETNCPASHRPSAAAWPFTTRRSADGVEWGGTLHEGRRYDPQRPFAVCGSYAVLTPAGRLSRLFSARFCRELFQTLARQKPLGAPGDEGLKACFASLAGLAPSPAEAGSDEPEAASPEPRNESWPADGFPAPPQLEFLRELAKEAAGETWRRLVAAESGGGGTLRTTWPTWQQLEESVGSISDDPVWRRLLDTYGDERFLKLPLDDWEQALGEFETLMEEGFVTRRRRVLNELRSTMPKAMVLGVCAALDTLFRRACLRPDLRMEPHRLAQALLGMVHAQARQLRDDLEKERLQVGQTLDYEPVRERLRRYKGRLLAEMTQIPSPVAVWCRFGLLLAACTGLALALPLPSSLAWVPPTVRLAGAGLVAVGALLGLWQHAYLGKKRLLETLKAWLAQYRVLLEAEDELRRKRGIEDALGDALKHLRGLHSGVASVGPEPAAIDPERQAIQRALARYADDLQEAAGRFSQLETVLLQSFQASRVETYLPNLDPLHRALFEREYAQFLGLADGPMAPAQQVAVLRELAQQLRAPERGAAPGPVGVVPFLRLKRDAGEIVEVPAWREAWVPPERILRPPYRPREGNAAAEFYLALAEQCWFERLQLRTLAQRWKDHPEAQAETTRRFNLRTMPSVEVGGAMGETMRMLLESGPNDPIVAACREQTNPHNELGNGRLTLFCQVQTGVSAEDVIFFPNRSAPTSLMGRAWLHHAQNPRHKALEPCPLSEEGGPQ